MRCRLLDCHSSQRFEVIDSPEKIVRALELVAPMVTEELITLEDVDVIQVHPAQT
jgi:PII-like signaling protein